MRAMFGVFLALITVGVVRAETPAFDPRSWKGEHVGMPTQVLTIGSTHLGQLDKRVTPEMLVPLLDKLAAFKPNIITHEGRSGEQCDVLKRYPARYPGIFDTYCLDTAEAEKATGLTVPSAMERIEQTLASWPAKPSASQRRQLTAYFLAANDQPSARVQWLQLAAVEQKTGDGINEPLLKIVTRTGAKPNEVYDVAAVLAARLGLQRIYAVDDHTADSIQGSAGPGLDVFLTKFWAPSAKLPINAELTRQENAVATGADVLELYRYMNRPESLRAFVTFDYKAAMNVPSPENYGRAYLAWWETRNLRMVSNIRAAFGNSAGARVLNIVGASHKAYYDAYLDIMSDVKLVDAEQILR
jgi:Family of unknown function (DUF5694)